MKVSDLFVRSLENEGVAYVFGVPGEENEAFLFSLENSSIQFIPCRHEQGAAFMADVWGRLTGKAGVCLSTLGPGATNLMTGVADANLDKAPLVAITAQGSLTRLHHESHQYLDIVQMFGPITKWNSAVSSPETVTEVVRKAFKIAQHEKPGATHIELAEDMAEEMAQVNIRPIVPSPTPLPIAGDAVIDRAVALLKQSSRPLIIAGRGAIRDHASRQLTNLVQKFDIPVASTFMGKGAVSDELPESLFSIGLGFRDYVTQATNSADLILTVGYDIAEYAPEMWNPEGDKKIIHLDTAPAEVYVHYNPAVEVIGDISSGLELIDDKLDLASPVYERHWYRSIRQQIKDDIAGYTLSDTQTFTIPGALNVIRSVLPKDGLLISDVGSHKMWIARNFPTYCPDGCVMSNGLASMGFALPGAIAAGILDPDRHIVAAMGDGGFLMNAQELETARRLDVGITMIIFNDDDYGLISWKQRQSRGRSVYTRISNPDFKRLAESFGIKAYSPETKEELHAVLEITLKNRELSLIALEVNPEVNDELIEKLDRFWRSQ